MRVALLAVAFVLAGALVSGLGGTSGQLEQVRVCGSAAFDRNEGACRTSQRSGLRSSSIYCSVRTGGLTGETFTGQLSYRGASFPAQRGTISGDGNVYTYLTIGGGPFPGGAWRCDVGAGGERASVTFTTSGPIGPVTSLASCLTKNTVLAGPVRACKASDTSLRASDAVTCSAVYSLAKGKLARADVLYEGKPTGLTLTRKVPLAVSVFGVQVSKPGGLPKGRYSCVFSLAGRKAATTTFRVG